MTSLSPYRYRGLIAVATCLLLFWACNNGARPPHPVPDSSLQYIKWAREDSLPLAERKKMLRLAYRHLNNIHRDSTSYWQLSTIVTTATSLDDPFLFNIVAPKATELAYSLNKPLLMGDAHWNYGAHFLVQRQLDSSYLHYHQAYKLFSQNAHPYYAGKMTYNLAYISTLLRDFTAAESLLFQAIADFEKSNKPKQLYLCFNQLGTIADGLEEYTKAFQYYDRALYYVQQTDRPFFHKVELWNNLGLVYQHQKEFKRALSYFDRGLLYDSITNIRPALYAKLLDNKSYTLFKMGAHGASITVPMGESLRIRDSIGDSQGAVIGRLHLAEYLASQGDANQALQYGKQALAMAKAHDLNRDILLSLELLANIDTVNTEQYLKEHISLGQFLSKKERTERNKMAAVRYETEKYMHQNEALFQQRFYIIGAATATTLLLFFVFLNTRQRARNRELLFEREQQQYNEDMFLMTLAQRTTLERGRSEERLRISQELHDGILAKLFALRFQWNYLELSGTPKHLLAHKAALKGLAQIEKDIRIISHDLQNTLIWDDLGFLNEMEMTLKERSTLGNFTYEFHTSHNERWEALDPRIKIHISRMLDEILQNSIKHANATKVNVAFLATPPTFTVRICDDGKGFNPRKPKKGIGLKNLRSRTQKINGTLHIHSQRGKGSTVVLTFQTPVRL